VIYLYLTGARRPGAPEGDKMEKQMKTEIQFDNGGGITIQTSNFCWNGNDATQAAEIAHGCVTSKKSEVAEFENTDEAMRFEFGGEKSSEYRWATTKSDLFELAKESASSRAGRAQQEFCEALSELVSVPA